MSTGTEIVKDGLRMIGAYSLASGAPDESFEIGKIALNNMMQLWRSRGIMIQTAPLDAIGDELSEPADTRTAIVANLAIQMAPYFDNGKQIVSQDLRNLAKSEFNAIKRLYQTSTTPLKVPSSTLPRGAGGRRSFNDSIFFGKGESLDA